MKKVILDCDNSMGLEKKHVDDGLALLFLIGRDDLNLLAVNSVFGNSSLEQTSKTTASMLKDFKLNNQVKHFKGAAEADDYDTDAARFLAQAAAENKNEITVIATGPLTNLYGAWKIDNDFFKNLNEIIVRGGMTEPLKIADKIIPEFNFSSDPRSAAKIMQAELPIALISGNLCLAARFGESCWRRVKRSKHKTIRAYIKAKISDWYQHSSEKIGLSGFYMRDVVAVVYLVAPEIFTYNKRQFVSTVSDLETGQIKTKKISDQPSRLKEAAIINLPTTVLDTKRFKDLIFASWDNIETTPAGFGSDDKN